MKKILLATTLLSALLVGCDQHTAPTTDGVGVHDNARTSLDWSGEYTGIEPCADCPGIETSLSLKDDGTYALSQTYQGKDDVPKITEGKFNWNDKGDTVTLTLGRGQTTQYFVGEQRIFHLDQNGQRVEGELADAYTLKKQENH